MGLIDTLRGRNGSDPAGVSEVVQRQRWQLDLMEENMRTLEASLHDGEWRKLGAELQREFTREGLDDLIDMSRGMYLTNPLIQRAVNITTYYTWGQGIEFSSDREGVMDGLVNPMVHDQHNKAELYGHQAQLLTDVDQMVDGNLFIALFHEADPVQLRSIPVEQVRQIHRNPDDRAEVWYYRRRWDALILDEATGRERTESREELHPDVGHQPTVKTDTIGGIKVRWDAPVLHQKVGGFKAMRFGVPATYAAIDWARAYRKFLEDWHTIVSSLARFAWRASTKGSKVGRLKDRLNTGVSDAELASDNSNPAPPAGSVFVGTDDTTLTPIPKTGANTSAEDARPSRLMVGAAMDLPDTILSGDADVGNLATAKTLDRPTELAMRSRQAMYSDFHQSIFMAAAVWGRQSRSGVRGADDPTAELVKVTFPPILEHDADATVRALVSAATLDGKVEANTIPRAELASMLMQAVGVEDIQDALKQLEKEQADELAQMASDLEQARADAAAQQPPPPPGQQPDGEDQQ